MTYVKGGAVVASVTNSASDLNGGVIYPSDFSETKKTRWGWTVGTGFELAFAPNWSLKTEYLYVDLGASECTVAVCGVSTDVSFKLNVVRAGLNYRF